MKHITEVQRYQIQSYVEMGLSQTKIATKLGVSKSTISRELKRNSDGRNGVYRADLAQRKANKRNQTKPKSVWFTPAIEQRVNYYLEQDYSPEQIKGICDKEGLPCVSHERIYQYVWEDKKRGGQLHTHLRRKGRKYRKRGAAKDNRGIIPNRVSIDQRPAIVEEKTRFGDLEADTIIGKKHKGAIVTINDRASGYLWMKKVLSKEAHIVEQAMVELLMPYAKYLHTITSDNGKEFARHESIAQALGFEFYFAHPYHSWERGANENTNGLVRQYIPKKTDFDDISDEDVQRICRIINERPRKRFDFENPVFVMNQLIKNSDVAFMT